MALKLASALGQCVADNKQSAEYAEIARKAAVDAISTWTEQQTRQLSFTGEHEQASEVWRRASDGSGFCEVARIFFGSLWNATSTTSLGVRPLLTWPTRRTATGSPAASETTLTAYRITRLKPPGSLSRSRQVGSIATPVRRMPSAGEISRFLSHQVRKLREELHREGFPTAHNVVGNSMSQS